MIEDRSVLCSNATLAGGVTVEGDCHIGQSATVRQFIRIGRGSTVGMGAVVVKDVPPKSIMAGSRRTGNWRAGWSRWIRYRLWSR
ncbi:MAG: hypothetical protein ACE15C_11050 [Phycisphaerae bacterium]